MDAGSHTEDFWFCYLGEQGQFPHDSVYSCVINVLQELYWFKHSPG